MCSFTSTRTAAIWSQVPLSGLQDPEKESDLCPQSLISSSKILRGYLDFRTCAIPQWRWACCFLQYHFLLCNNTHAWLVYLTLTWTLVPFSHPQQPQHCYTVHNLLIHTFKQWLQSHRSMRLTVPHIKPLSTQSDYSRYLHLFGRHRHPGSYHV